MIKAQEIKGKAIRRVRPFLWEKRAIRKWLRLAITGKRYTCPFWKEALQGRIEKCGVIIDRYPYRVCGNWFPKTRSISRLGYCPCNNYPLRTVIERAKEMVKL